MTLRPYGRHIRQQRRAVRAEPARQRQRIAALMETVNARTTSLAETMARVRKMSTGLAIAFSTAGADIHGELVRPKGPSGPAIMREDGTWALITYEKPTAT